MIKYSYKLFPKLCENNMNKIKNSNEKLEVFKTIWKIANDLRGKVSGWEFKSYVLGALCYRCLSENISSRINNMAYSCGDYDFNYANCSDDEIKSLDGFRERYISEIGFFLYPSELFCNVLKNAPKNENLNETIEIVLKNIENSAIGFASEKCFSGLFKDFDVNSVNLGSTVQKRNENLMKLLNGVGEIDFGDFTNNSIDLLGDAYEFLMAMYAANAGKSGGEYFTPQEVSTLLTKICLIKYDGSQKDFVRKVYDPTCGSGSLLLKSAKILGKDNVDIGFFGQECNPTTYNLCRINMFLHNIPYEKFHISCEDTLVCPQHLGDQPFDVIVSNPPYSVKWLGDNDVTLINDPRFSPAGVLAPKSKADFAFIMHCLSCLSTDGKAAIVCFPGVLYRSGAEQKIRQYLVDNNFIDSIIQLPPNLFFGTGISTCILTLSKSKPDNNVLFIDASDEFIHVKNSNKLSDQNLANILSFYSERKDRQYISILVTNDEISNKSYNLSVSSYVEKKSDEEEIDIIELNKKIKECHERNQRLCSEIDKIINEISYKGGDSHVKAG